MFFRLIYSELIHLYINPSIYLYTHTYINICVCMCECIFVRVCSSEHVQIKEYFEILPHDSICLKCFLLFIYPHTHTHIYTCVYVCVMWVCSRECLKFRIFWNIRMSLIANNTSFLYNFPSIYLSIYLSIWLHWNS